MTMVSFRLQKEEAEAVQHWAKELDIERSTLLRHALHRYLADLQAHADIKAWHDAPLTESESSLAAAASWGPAEDWSDWGDAEG
ncbi:MAG: ribbon-helix-helix protein, CopG family [Chloroflexi bacterium]|nr:ribbon-helix-helix protein, CopG family [Chloroflexota bacterium]